MIKPPLSIIDSDRSHFLYTYGLVIPTLFNNKNNVLIRRLKDQMNFYRK